MRMWRGGQISVRLPVERWFWWGKPARSYVKDSVSGSLGPSSSLRGEPRGNSRDSAHSREILRSYGTLRDARELEYLSMRIPMGTPHSSPPQSRHRFSLSHHECGKPTANHPRAEAIQYHPIQSEAGHLLFNRHERGLFHPGEERQT
jgi:hypothetical protein